MASLRGHCGQKSAPFSCQSRHASFLLGPRALEVVVLGVTSYFLLLRCFSTCHTDVVARSTNICSTPRMANRPCLICRQAFGRYSNFFFLENDSKGFGNGPVAHLAPINGIKAAASTGCPICTVLVTDLSIKSLHPIFQERLPATLQRAALDPDRAVAVYVGMDDVSHTSFSRVPLSWAHLSLAQLDKPNDDLTIMKSWVTNCIKNHPKCRNNAQSFIPTRLLDVNAFADTDDIQLVSLDLKHCPVRYVALSHCWGTSMQLPITTSMCTLTDRMKRINYSDLSCTFQDAVRLTRQLDQRYLWIDSLCIIQDYKDDWLNEAASMAAVYSNSIFTIFALSSSTSAGGCRINAQNKP